MLKKLIYFALLGSMAGQVSVTLLPPAKTCLESAGSILNGGSVGTFAAGTTTPLASYTDSTGTVPNANPVVLDSSGCANIWLGPSSYKIVVKKSDGTTVYTTDGINGAFLNFLSLNGSNVFTAVADPAIALGKFWLSLTTTGRLKWSDAAAIHTVVGADTTDTLSNKTIDTSAPNTIKINGNTLSATAGTATVTVPNTTGTLGLQSGTMSYFAQATGVCTASVNIFPYPLGGSVLACTDVTGNGEGFVMTSAGTIKNLFVKSRVGGSLAASGMVTIRSQAGASTITCTIGTGTTCSDTTHTLTVVAGDRITATIATAAGETLADVSIAFEKQ